QLGPRLLAMLSTYDHMVEVDRISDMLEAGRAYARVYAAAKQAEGLVDFNDLIARTIALLQGDQQSAWVSYKLDSKIDHLLLDEAQDTNVDQWRIVKSLTDEFFAGEGQKGDTQRTLFVVGDHKQAIYRFQGTDPQTFSDFQTRTGIKAQLAGQPLVDISLTDNYRSSAPILALVDGVIGALGNRAFGLNHDDPIRHTAAAVGAPGRITCSPLQSIDADADDDVEAEAEENDTSVTAEQRLVADKIARSVRAMIDGGIDGEPVVPGDIMVLLRRRGGLAGVIVSQLQGQGVPIAGVDRLRLQRPIAVQDLLSAIRFALQPLDDLNLAALLVSPLCGWSHQHLMERAQRPLIPGDSRRRVPLWRHLREQPALAQAIAPLRTMLDLAGYVGPFAFLEAILSGEIAGRAKLLARLGEAARDPIEELLSQALAFETRHGPSLHGFVRWFDSYDEDIKREFEGKADAVRVMTVHGSKGLQARIVILADAGDAVVNTRGGGQSTPLMWRGDDRLPLPGDVPIPRKTTKQNWPPAWQRVADDDAARELEENRRLLYVAMTRAERMLFVAGRDTKQSEEAPPRWHDIIKDQMLAMGAVTEDDPVWGPCIVHAVRASGRDGGRVTARETGEPTAGDKPAWLFQKPVAEARPPRPLAPSRMTDAADLSVTQPPRAASNLAALENGRLLHAMFERLPRSSPAEQEVSLRRWLANHAASLAEPDREAMIASVIAVAAAPEHAELFGPDALAEVPFSAVVEGEVIAGTVDRMIVSNNSVRIVDFKTSHRPPTRAENIHRGHRLQMAAYHRAMKIIFPDHSISVGLLYTANTRLFWLADALLDRDWAGRDQPAGQSA
ncbi:MAG: UvrD-helicase domain-containing protein, partial [Sphingopyxis sp.]|nr:UvrD-helicase domain-containing protein [Sphingopyxis sp.]